MKVAIINKSDATGGAAVVSFRLLNALRKAGVDARMFVTEKLTDSEYVSLVASPLRIKRSFISERLKIFLANGLNRANLFKLDTCSDGLPLHKIPFIAEADIISLNWVNQGMLSLREISHLAAMGKKIVWTMHDMWCFTGVCHHSGKCDLFMSDCKSCHILGQRAFCKSLAHSTLLRKKRCYDSSNISFVAVSNWLADRGRSSFLFDKNPPIVIPNPFPIDNKVNKEISNDCKQRENRKFKILFGAARLDDTVKGLPILIEVTKLLKKRMKPGSPEFELLTFGVAKDPEALSDISIPHTHLGRVPSDKLSELYHGADIILSTSLYETLPGTLVEGQAYGAIPVALNRGGQPDIISHRDTGYLAEWNDDISVSAANIVEGLIWAAETLSDPATNVIERMHRSVYTKFNEDSVAAAYIDLFKSLLK